MVADINPGADWRSPLPHGFVALGDGRALFAADDGATGRELWVSDGTAAGTRMAADIAPGAQSSDPRGSVALGDGRALFSAWKWADDGSDASDSWTWVTDGTAAGTAPLLDAGLFSGVSLDPLG
jgi:ELWxxDGT repeat protein